jgi:triacylglycerol lipase
LAPVHHIYLIPGFFGFANLGRLRYFLHVHRFLVERSAARGFDVRVHVVKTHPTSSLPLRAVAVAEVVAATLRQRNAVAHLVGHSTGGLDARLFTTPGVSLPTEIDVERWATRVHSVITVATPHHGAPVASFLASLGGQQLLALLSLSTSYVLRFGHLPLTVLLQVTNLFRRSELLGPQHTLFDEVSQHLLADFSLSRRRAVQKMLALVMRDQSLLVQLTPESMDVFNAAVRDRPAVRYSSIVTRARPPSLGSALAAGADPAAQAIHALYQALYRVAASSRPSREPAMSRHNAAVLRRAYGRLPHSRANDGIVPTRSQVWGDVLGAVQADHLDVIGHFNDPSTKPPHFDWLTTGSGFTGELFEAVWEDVLSCIAGGEEEISRERSRRPPAVPAPRRAPRKHAP